MEQQKRQFCLVTRKVARSHHNSRKFSRLRLEVAVMIVFNFYIVQIVIFSIHVFFVAAHNLIFLDN